MITVKQIGSGLRDFMGLSWWWVTDGKTRHKIKARNPAHAQRIFSQRKHERR